MKVITHNLGDFKEIYILPLADLHHGDIHSDYKLVQEWIEFIRTTPNAFCILNGDLMDAAIKSSIGDTYGASLQPMEQLQQCVKLFMPIADKIFAVLPGNHEMRIYKSDGLDVTQLMCTQLGIGDRYSPGSAVVFVRFGKWEKHRHGEPVCYSIYCVHGSGGGRTEGAKINRLTQLASIVDCDIYIHSHTHLPAVTKLAYYRVHLNNSSVKKVDKLFVNTAAALDYGGYGELASLKPACKDTPIIMLDGTKRSMRARL